ncbi:hypothetical protein SKP52_24090 (plasmid) [Sphingopyxis fribergensis]|jgi:hypothetical protein|uniref:Uncharacterized protein n=1 Tax=Sphingopyxis fribergensis TaxID=1515612 RepID=A0A0A7PNR4_9SPHN|nr:hypothetical protein SKP52_24090 [Sphingopyxis fribergensis]
MLAEPRRTANDFGRRPPHFESRRLKWDRACDGMRHVDDLPTVKNLGVRDCPPSAPMAQI